MQFNQQMAGCILADIHMPGLSGLELQSRLNELGSSIPIVVMTGNADVPSAIRAMKHGALDFIEKPIETESLLSAVGTGLAKREAELNSKNSTSNASARIAELTPRERDVLTRLIGGQPNKIIAHESGNQPAHC